MVMRIKIDLRVKRNPLRLSVTKNDVEYSVDQLSDGEKCTLALLGENKCANICWHNKK